MKHGPGHESKVVAGEVEVLETAEEADCEGKVTEEVVLEGEEAEAAQAADGGVQVAKLEGVQDENLEIHGGTKLGEEEGGRRGEEEGGRRGEEGDCSMQCSAWLNVCYVRIIAPYIISNFSKFHYFHGLPTFAIFEV